MKKIGFDNDKYIATQSAHIKERIAHFGGKLYLEFGGKLFDDYHASRVLPGFAPDSKVRMLCQMKDDAEIVIVISAGDIEKNKVRSPMMWMCSVSSTPSAASVCTSARSLSRSTPVRRLRTPSKSV